MIGFMNKCPHCGGDSSFVPEEMECDKALVLWCRYCGEFVNQTFTLETLRRWWARYDEGEESIKPPVSKDMLARLIAIEEELRNDPDCHLDRVEIHLKDFTDYHYTPTEKEDNNEGQSDS